MPFILNEDAAVKAKLQGLTVTDANSPQGGRPVKVRYRLPETELAQQTFPLIVINRTGISKIDEREHRGRVGLTYTPEQYPDWNPDVLDPKTSPYVVDYPVPVDITYQITVLARKEQHIVACAAQLSAQDRLPFRFGFIAIPQDGTVRSLFLDAGPEFEVGKDGDDKRLFQVHYGIRVASELTPSTIDTATGVTAVDVNVALDPALSPSH